MLSKIQHCPFVGVVDTVGVVASLAVVAVAVVVAAAAAAAIAVPTVLQMHGCMLQVFPISYFMLGMQISRMVLVQPHAIAWFINTNVGFLVVVLVQQTST